MQRRQFPAALLGVLAAAARVLGRTPAHRHVTPVARCVLGERHLEHAGVEQQARALVDWLARTSAATGRPPGDLAAVIRARDFAAGRTVVIDGWVLAESEGLVAAALALVTTRAT